MYIRKTKDIYILIWRGEEIDETDDRGEAVRLKKEYIQAFHGGTITIKKRRIKK